ETNIDLNPVNPQNLVAVATHTNLRRPQPRPEADAAYFSLDGGQTWGASSPLPVSFQGIARDIVGDPSVAFDSRGNVYVAHLAANFDFTARTFTDAAVLVAKSTDGGETFTQLTPPALATSPGMPYDHTKVAVDHSPTSPFRDTVYVTW